MICGHRFVYLILTATSKMRQIKLKKFQRGLSLLMTMTLLAIIGILAEVALSAYEDHVAQEQVAKQ